MTTITLFAAPRGREALLQRAFQPDDTLKSALDTLASASNVSPPYSFKVFNPAGDLLNVTAQRAVGMQPLSVEIEASAIDALRAKGEQQDSRLAGLEADLKGVKEQMAGAASIHLKICSAHIMHTAFGAPFIQTYSHVVRGKVTEPAVVSLAGLAGLTPAAFAEKADQLLDRRNNTAAHQTSAAQLDEHVEACQAMITPALRIKHKWETWTVDNYNNIKQLLPDRFR